MTEPRESTIDSGARAGLVPERFDPVSMRGDLIEAEHLSRYWWVGQLAAGARVLDAGCGLAYGTQMLADAGATATVGVDIAASMLEIARGRVTDAVELVAAPMEDLPFPDGHFDLVVCFEAIEHVEDPRAALEELGRVLAPGGTLAVSSPNRDQYPPGNPHHVHEYVPDALAAELERRFRHVELHAQHDLVVSCLLPARARDRDRASLREIDQLRLASAIDLAPGRELYTIALASDRPLQAPAPRAVATALVEVRRWLELYDGQQATLDRQHRALAEREATQRELAALRDRLASAETLLARLPTLEVQLRAARAASEQLAEVTAQRDRLHLRLEHSDRVMATLKRSPSWRLTAPLRAAKALMRRK